MKRRRGGNVRRQSLPSHRHQGLPYLSAVTHSESKPSPKDWLKPTLVVLVVVVGLGAVIAAQLSLTGYLSMAEAFGITLPLWLPWVVFAPVTVWLAFRFPLERGCLKTSVTVHLAACALVIAGSQMAMRHFMAHPGSGGTLTRMTPPPEKAGHSPLDLPRGWKPGGLGPPGGPAFARMVVDALTYGILLSLCQTMAWSRRARHRELRAITAEGALAQARLSALRMQLHPHFLFNSLNGIATLVHTDPQAADDMIGNLSELLRLSLDTSAEQEIPLLRELEFLQRYLDIEQARFGDRLHVVRDIAADTLAACVPTLLLQPILENAIRHGFESITAPGTVTLSARRVGDRLFLEVSDNGAGLTDQPAEGIGLANTRARLRALYGDAHELVIRNRGTGGCAVAIRIPFHYEPTATPAFPSP